MMSLDEIIDADGVIDDMKIHRTVFFINSRNPNIEVLSQIIPTFLEIYDEDYYRDPLDDYDFVYEDSILGLDGDYDINDMEKFHLSYFDLQKYKMEIGYSLILFYGDERSIYSLPFINSSEGDNKHFYAAIINSNEDIMMEQIITGDDMEKILTHHIEILDFYNK